MITLLSRDAKGKIRVAKMWYDWDENIHAYHIERQTGILHGKLTQQPTVFVTQGKASRTLKQQVDLQFNSTKKKYMDKGYMELPNDLETYTDAELEELVNDAAHDQAGVLKPMLAKQADKITNRKIFDNEWYASRKIDGVRCLMYFKDGEVHTASRGGGDYDPSTTFIREHETLVKFFKKHPDIILDGELYKMGASLQQISGAARLEKDTSGMDWLQYYIYDIVDIDKPFKDRLLILNQIEDELNLGFDPYREFKDDELRLQMVPHVKVSGWDNMMKLHNEYVSDGWEGVVIRDPKAKYKPNGRSQQMIKIKCYLDAEFKVVGYELGLRGSEDMVFICEMEDGRTFKASPLGSRAVKKHYVDGFDIAFKDQMGTCKYFYLSDDGIPLQPKFIAFRYD